MKRLIRRFQKDFQLPLIKLEAKLVTPKPLVVLFDEVDVLQGEAMISFLRQMRDGFTDRGTGKFPISIAVVGMRDLKDYITASTGGRAPNPGSPFNIKENSATLSNFSKNDISRLFAETGQQITQEALDYVYEQSRGQPWIVNSLFKRATLQILDEESAETVTLDHIVEAREKMIMTRETHLDALAYRLKEPGISFARCVSTKGTGANTTVSRQVRRKNACLPDYFQPSSGIRVKELGRAYHLGNGWGYDRFGGVRRLVIKLLN